MKEKAQIMLSGPKLVAMRKELSLTQTQLGQAIGKSLARVQSYESSEASGVYPSLWLGLAKLLNVSPEEAKRKLGVFEAVTVTPDPENPYGGSEVFLIVPEFDMSVAAGNWTQVPEPASVYEQVQMEKGLFRIRISGDSMQPDYHPGDLLEFRVLREFNGDRLYIGHDYYVQRDDEATFKRLVSIDEEKLVFAAVNKKKYPKPMPVLRGDIRRMAEYVGIFSKAKRPDREKE